MEKKVMIDFGNLKVMKSFEQEEAVDIRKPLGNRIHQTTGDIGFDDLAHTIYFSEGAVEIPNEYIESLREVVKGYFLAYIQKAVNELLNQKEE